MSHAPYEGWLAIYPDLSPAERDAVDAHLRECPQCTALLAEYRAIQRDLQECPDPSPSGRLRQGFYAAVARAREQERGISRWSSLRRMGLAVGNAAAWAVVAVVAAVLVAGVTLAWRPLARRAWPGATPVRTPGVDLAGSDWELTALKGQPPIKGTEITLGFDGGKASGFAGCNAYGLEYTSPAEGALSYGFGSITVQLCRQPQGVMEQEQAYWEVLRTATSYRLVGDRLEMANAAGETVLTFRKVDLLPMDPADLEGREWQLVSWDGHPAIEGSPITIAFAQGKIGGQAGCRGYTGTYEAAGNHIRFPMLEMTEIEPQCSPALQEQEGAYTTALSWVTHYHLEGDQLELLTARGETLLYRATGARPSPTAGAEPAIPTTTSVDGWVGAVVKLDSTAQFDDYFQRLDGERYGIDGSAAGLASQIESARQQGTAIALWGRLLTGVPDVNGRQIVVERLEVASVPGTAAPAITPIATGASIRVSGWSPDGQWLAFWQAGGPAVLAYQSSTATLHFYNARSQEICSCELQTTNACPTLTWLDDGEVIVRDGEVAMQGPPCRGSFRPVEAPAPDPASLSPGGSYRVSTAYEGQGDAGLLATSAFADAVSGRQAMVVTCTLAWGDSPGLPTGPAGQWVTDGLFLINYSLDRGPLLVDVAEGRVIEVMRELFGVTQAQSRDLGFYASAQAVAGGDAYHIVLGGGAGIEADFPPLRLYHSETGEVEELPFKYAWGPTFSPEGRWLLLDARPTRALAGTDRQYESYALWARPVDPPASPGRLVAEGQPSARWSSDWTRVAMAGPGVNYGLPNVISVYSFPEGTLLGSWATGDYAVQPDAWSPDGRWLAMSGNVPGEWKYALFVVQP